MLPQFIREVLRARAEVDYPTALKRQELSPPMSTLTALSIRDFACVSVADWLRTLTVKSSPHVMPRSATVRASAAESAGIC
jgi:hypothetical protein